MSVNINNEGALHLMAQIEGGHWEKRQLEDTAGYGEYGFFWACNQIDRGEGPVTIYGDGGYARYHVRQDGTIILLGGTTTQQKEEHAAKLGFDVTLFDRMALARDAMERNRRKTERRQDMEGLCGALILDVAIALGISPEAAMQRVKSGSKYAPLMAMMLSRINGWVNVRLGVVDEEVMADYATVCRSRAENDGIVRLTGDLRLELCKP